MSNNKINNRIYETIEKCITQSTGKEYIEDVSQIIGLMFRDIYEIEEGKRTISVSDVFKDSDFMSRFDNSIASKSSILLDYINKSEEFLLENRDNIIQELYCIIEWYMEKYHSKEVDSVEEQYVKADIEESKEEQTYSKIDEDKLINFKIKSNPFNTVNYFYENNTPCFAENIKRFKNLHINELGVDFIETVSEIFNSNNINIHFEGSQFDFNDLEAIVEEYNTMNKTSVKLKPGTLIYDLNRTQQLKELRHKFKTSGIDALNNPEMIKYFDEYLNENNDIVIVATMSSGKSTLINSMLGKKLMPSKNEACTAKIVNIKNNNELNDFIDENNRKVDLELLKDINANTNTSIHVKLQGPIKTFYDVENFHIIDTPGPNNSLDNSHRTITYNYIKSDKKPVIIVMLDGTKLLTDDESNFINIIARETQNNGKIDEERFIFVVNKADQFKSDDNLDSMKKNIKNKLKEYGINNPKIHFISAYNALVTRLSLNDQELNDDDDDHLDMVLRKTQKDRYIYDTYSDLSPSVKKKLQELMIGYKENDDYENMALIRSGVIGLELSIKEYINKYKNIKKVKDIVRICNNIIEKNDILYDIENKIKLDKTQRSKLSRAIKELSEKIENEKHIDSLRKDINNIKFGDNLNKIQTNMDIEFDKLVKSAKQFPIKIANGKKLIPQTTANKALNELQNKYEHLRADLVSEFTSSVNKDIFLAIEKTLSRYMEYISEICKDIDYPTEVKLDKFVMNSGADYMSLAEKCKVKETVYKSELIENPKKNGWKVILFWRDKYISTTVSEDYEGVELKIIVDATREAKEDLYKLYKLIAEERKKAKEKCLEEINKQISVFNDRIKENLDALSKYNENIKYYDDRITDKQKIFKEMNINIKIIKSKLKNILSI